jgi:hypothetical protein
LISTSTVVQLNESNFERLTRASSGQNNGKWFVMFTTSNNLNDPVLQNLASVVSDGIHVATVNVLENRKLSERFAIRFFPSHIYFAKKRMCTYRGPTSGDSAIQAMTTFVETRYQSIEGSLVPPPPTIMDQWQEVVKKGMTNANRIVSILMEDMEHIAKYRKNAAFVLVLMGGVVGALVVLVLLALFPTTRKQSNVAKLQKID